MVEEINNDRGTCKALAPASLMSEGTQLNRQNADNIATDLQEGHDYQAHTDYEETSMSGVSISQNLRPQASHHGIEEHEGDTMSDEDSDDTDADNTEHSNTIKETFEEIAFQAVKFFEKLGEGDIIKYPQSPYIIDPIILLIMVFIIIFLFLFLHYLKQAGGCLS